MHYKKLLVLLGCACLSISTLAGCSSTKSKKNPSPEATTSTEKKYTADVSAEQLLKATEYNVEDYVTLPKNYQNMTINLNGETTYTEEGLKKYITDMISSVPAYRKVDRDKIKAGDVIEIDYTEKIEDAEEENATQKNFKLTLGAQFYPDEAEKKFIGKKVGDSFNITFTYPKDYTPELSNKKSTLTGKINGIYEEKPMTFDGLTDDYINENFKDSYNVSTVKDFVHAVKKEYKSQLEYERAQLIQTNLQTEIAKKSKVKIPDKLLDKRIKEETDTLKSYAKDSGMNHKEFLKQQYGMDEKQFKKEIKKAVENELILEALVKDMNFGISSEEFEDSMQPYLSYGYESLDDIYKEFGGKETLMLNFAESKAIEELSKKIKVVD